MKLETIRKKARNNSLEVEHLLAAAKARTPGLKEELSRLSSELQWPESTHLPDGSHVVPLGRWAVIAGAYADGGIDALAPLTKEQENTCYVIGLLEELNSAEAVAGLLSLFREAMFNPQANIELSHRLTMAFNQLLAIKGAISPSEEQASRVREFLVALYRAANADVQRTWILYALRGVGNASTLQFLASLHELTPPQEAARKEAVRIIKKRAGA